MPELFDLEDQEPEVIEPTQEEKDAAAAEAREAKERENQQAIDKFKAFAQVIENAPERGGYQPPQPVFTAEQRKAVGEKLQELQLTDPATYNELMLNQASQNAYARMVRDAAPIVEATTKRFIKDFKTDRAGDDKFFKEVQGKFDEECRDLTSADLLNMGDDRREKELMRRWKAAKADVLDSKVDKAQSRAPFGSAGGGTSVGPSPGRGEKTKVVTLDDADKKRILSNCSGDVERAKKLIASIEYGE